MFSNSSTIYPQCRIPLPDEVLTVMKKNVKKNCVALIKSQEFAKNLYSQVHRCMCLCLKLCKHVKMSELEATT